jgi:hypothetical protein
MNQITQRINEHNAQRQEHITSGQAAIHPEWFAQWESTELQRRSEFEKQMLTAHP